MGKLCFIWDKKNVKALKFVCCQLNDKWHIILLLPSWRTNKYFVICQYQCYIWGRFFSFQASHSGNIIVRSYSFPNISLVSLGTNSRWSKLQCVNSTGSFLRDNAPSSGLQSTRDMAALNPGQDSLPWRFSRIHRCREALPLCLADAMRV